MTLPELLIWWQEKGDDWARAQLDHDQPLIITVRGLAYENLVGWESGYQSSYSAGQIAFYRHAMAICDALLKPPAPPPVVVPPTKPYTGPLFTQLSPLQAWYTALPQGYKPPPPQEAPKLVTIPPTVQEILSRASRILVT